MSFPIEVVMAAQVRRGKPVTAIPLDRAFLQQHPVELLNRSGETIARFCTMRCAARSAALRKDGGRYSARDMAHGEVLGEQELLQLYNQLG